MAEKISLYVHIPFCRSKCDYCDFYSLAGKEDRMDDYQKALIKHLKETAPYVKGYPVESIYFGGAYISVAAGNLCQEAQKLQTFFINTVSAIRMQHGVRFRRCSLKETQRSQTDTSRNSLVS